MKHRALQFPLAAIAVALAVVGPVRAQTQQLPIWPGKVAPGSEHATQKELEYTYPAPAMKMVRNVVMPSVTVFAPERAQANGTAVIIAPGGGMRMLSWQNEGTALAEYLAKRGVTAFVLRYRLLPTPADPAAFDAEMQKFFAQLSADADRRPGEPSRVVDPPEMKATQEMAVADGRQAVKFIRTNAARWAIEPDRIVMMGFSAGGYVTLSTLTGEDAATRPDFVAPIYPGMDDALRSAVVAAFADRPAGKPRAVPMFLLVAQDDRWVFPMTRQLFSDWGAAGLPVELHSFARGGHGFGMFKQGLPVDGWVDLYVSWLDSLGLMKRGDKPHTGSIVGAPTSEKKKQ